ncbi:MAG: putative Ig domain-containing protein [Thermoplasmatota archaeon]
MKRYVHIWIVFIMISSLFAIIVPTASSNEFEQETSEFDPSDYKSNGFFTENLGQWDDELLYVGDTPFGQVGLGKSSVFFNMVEYETVDNMIPDFESIQNRILQEEMDPMRAPIEETPTKMDVKGHVLKYSFEGANDVAPVGVEVKNHRNNYFLGNDPDKWVRGARNFETVLFPDIYENIDLKYYFNSDGTKYDIILKPGADPNEVRIRVDGHDSLNIDNGALSINQNGKELISDGNLVSYQQDDLSLVPSSFKLIDDDTYGFELDHYDRTRTTVIDPVIFSTYIGNDGAEVETPLLRQDSLWNPVLFDEILSIDFPTTTGAYDRTHNGDQDLIVTKVKDDGTDLVFSTYIGGDGEDLATEFILDDDDNIIMRGYTESTNFPTSSGAYQSQLSGGRDLYLFRLKNDGSDMISSTLIGGTGTESFTLDIGLKSNGNLIAAGSAASASSDFPILPGAYDSTFGGTSEGLIFEMSVDATTLVFSTFFGGASTESVPFFEVQSNGEIWVCGHTSSIDFPATTGAFDDTYNGASDVFFLKMNSDGTDVLYSTFIGGTASDTLTACEIDDNGDIYMVGLTGSTNFPYTSGSGLAGGNDFYALKMKSDFSDIIYSRLIGGMNNEIAPDMKLTGNGEMVIEGYTYSTDFPITPNALDSTLEGTTDNVIVKLSSDGTSILASTFYDWDGGDTAYLVIGPEDEIVLAGYTNSTDMPTTPDAEFQTIQGSYDQFLLIYNDDFSDIQYGTYFGGSASDYGRPYYFKDTEDLFIVGYSRSTDFPTTNGSFDSSALGEGDFILVKFWEGDFEPTEVYSVSTFSDIDHLQKGRSFDIGQEVYVEILGLDSDNTRINVAAVDIKFDITPHNTIRTRLFETDIDSGIFKGSFIVPPGVLYTDTLEIISKKDPSKSIDILIEPPFRPSSVSSIGVFSDEACTISVDKLDKGDTGYAKIIGVDTNPSFANKALGNVTSIWNSSVHIPFVLTETGANTGEYVGSFIVPETSGYFENFTVYSVRNEAAEDVVMVHTPVQIRPLADRTNAKEDEEYRSPTYWNFGYETATWSTSFIAPWLTWDEENLEFHGTPNNNHVGPWDVHVEISDGKGHLDSHDFQIQVQNTPPNITTANVLFATEGVEYMVDYNSSDDGQGEVTWSMIPDNSWLSINKNTGVLSGIPADVDIGNKNISIIAKDQHGGIGSTSFMLTVIGVNSPPRITSLDIKTGKQDENYFRQYQAHDPDGDTDFTWTLRTDANFLTMESDTGILQGTPGKYDVGDFFVNITVADPMGANASREFILSIENVNDMPEWVDVPVDAEIIHGQWFRFDVNATDPDPGGFIEYSVLTDPETDMDIDEGTGEMEWLASVLPFSTSFYDLEVTIKASDGVLFNKYEFTITVIPTESPTSTIWGPGDGEKVVSQGAVLEWEGTDPEEEALTFDIYLHENQAFVAGFREEAVYLIDYSGTSLTVNDLDQGKTYYWLVIPYDGGTHGSCESGVRSFKVNYRPVVQSVSQQEAKTGSEFSLKISASDGDAEDSGNLVYTLTEAPAGMTIKEETGVIKWKPSSSQEGYHTVTVEVSDGVETVVETFDIEVLKGEEGGLPIGLIAGIGIALAIIILVVILFFFFKKRSAEKEKELDEEAERIKMEMERHQKEKEWEEEHMKPHIPDNETSSVPLSATEAHAHDKDKRYDQPDYEDLYGQPAPEVEEGEVTTEELRDHIKETADQLEQMEETPSEEDDFLDKMVASAHIEKNDTVERGVE